MAGGYYVEPTILAGNNKMRVFQEEIFGKVVSVTKFKDEADALAIANDTLYGLGAGVWSRNGNTAYRMADEKADKLIAHLKAQHGPLIFHQSGGCCDGSTPMCFKAGEFRVGAQDVLLGEISGKFYIGAAQL